VWYFRRLLLDALQADLTAELAFITKIGRSSPKNYQIWQHRKVIIDKTRQTDQELTFTSEMIDEDGGKNYHSWAHRQWVIETFGLWENELDFIEDSLKLDLRNNSAWNQRYFVVSKWKKLTPEVISEEIQYAFKYIMKAPNNQSPWAYLKGLLLNKSYSDFPVVKETCSQLMTKFVACCHILSLLVDINEQENTPESNVQAKELCGKLAAMDTTRAEYWHWRQNNVK